MKAMMQWKSLFCIVTLLKNSYAFETMNDDKKLHMKRLLAKVNTEELEKLKRLDNEFNTSFKNSRGVDKMLQDNDFYFWSDIPK